MIGGDERTPEELRACDEWRTAGNAAGRTLDRTVMEQFRTHRSSNSRRQPYSSRELRPAPCVANKCTITSFLSVSVSGDGILSPANGNEFSCGLSNFGLLHYR